MAHAYLISTNDIQKCTKVLLGVIKNIFCVQEYVENCNKCTLCHLIDINNLPSLKIIEPDGSYIKKSQILELRNLFSKESQYTKENIYIVKSCERMNKESANTMLKFLEEPEGNVIGFFITNNYDSVIPTIQSRCQHLDVKFLNNTDDFKGLDETKYNSIKDNLEEYLYKIEVERKLSILYNKEYLKDYEREDIKVCFQMLLEIYLKKMNSKLASEEKNDVFSFLDKYTYDNLYKKVNLIMLIVQELNYNVNLDMILDKFVLEMEVINNETI